MIPSDSAPRRFAAWVVLVGAVVVPCVYLPTLGTRFDFIDDGNLVYPAPPMPLGDRVHMVWHKVVANYEHLGPFRPTLWAHWELFAELCGGDAGRWRCVRLVWTGLAAAALLALMRELRLHPAAALTATALAMGNPYRNEIWTSLTLSEGVAMPYALGGLWCAARAGRSRCAPAWELASAAGLLVAIGCKNTFAALVPVQIYLRLAANGVPTWAGLRRAGWLALKLSLPLGHYVYFRMHWRPGQYAPTSVTFAPLGREVSTMFGAMSGDFLALGFVLAIVAVHSGAMLATLGKHGWAERLRLPMLAQSGKHGTRSHLRTAYTAAALLLACGLAAYAPMPSMSGRYAMPGVWGLDLMFAALLTQLTAVPSVAWRRCAWVAIVGGLCAVVAASLGRQDKFAARADVLWQTLESLECSTTPGERLTWVCGPKLNVEEGIHAGWHLAARGHPLAIDVVDPVGQPLARREVAATSGDACWAVTGDASPPPKGSWRRVAAHERRYWGGWRQYHCYLWSSVVNGARP